MTLEMMAGRNYFFSCLGAWLNCQTPVNLALILKCHVYLFINKQRSSTVKMSEQEDSNAFYARFYENDATFDLGFDVGDDTDNSECSKSQMVS